MLLSASLFVCWAPLLAQQTGAKDTLLIGEAKRADLERNFSWFDEQYRKYTPNDTTIKELKHFVGGLHVVIVLGTWCSDSKEHVPAFFKVADQVGMKESSVRLIAVNRKKDRILTPETDSLHFEYVPTFIIYQHQKEIGRIVEDTKVSMEKDLLQIVNTQRRH